MSYLQDVYIYASNGVQFTCHIISGNNASPFSAESLIFDPRLHTLFSSLHPIGVQFKTAKDAYREIINFCVKYTKTNNLHITKIDNPCNAPFINKADQQKFVDQKKLNIIVQVNGQ